MKSTQFGDVPNTWGNSELTTFIDHARYNQLATFVNSRHEVSALEEIDKVIHACAQNMSHIKGQFLGPLFVLRCHSAYRAAAQLAMAGHVAETFVMIRSILEYAGYGLMIAKHSEMENLWMNRHVDANAPKKIAKSFCVGEIRAEIEKCNSDDAKRFDEFYQRSIDFGAHPNSHAVNSSLNVTSSATELIMLSKYLHDGDKPHRHALKSAAQAGVCALRLFQFAFPTRLGELDVLGKIDSILVAHPL